MNHIKPVCVAGGKIGAGIGGVCGTCMMGTHTIRKVYREVRQSSTPAEDAVVAAGPFGGLPGAIIETTVFGGCCALSGGVIGFTAPVLAPIYLFVMCFPVKIN